VQPAGSLRVPGPGGQRPGGIAGTMADDAIAHGDGYHPGPGGIVAVLMLDGPTQLVFIEVDP
jgi:hypothetical protein